MDLELDDSSRLTLYLYATSSSILESEATSLAFVLLLPYST